MADQPTIDEFEAECRAFLDANAKPKRDEGDKKFVWGEGDDDVALFEEVDREQELRELAEAKEWRAKRYDAGLGWITGAEGVRRPRAARRPTTGSTAASRASTRCPARASSASASAWWRRRSWPTPRTT